MTAFLHGMRDSKFGQHAGAGKATMRYPPLLDVVEELDKRFPYSHCIKGSALNDMGLTKCDKKTALFSSMQLLH